MNDDDLLTEIRGRLEPARMTVPLDEVVARGTARQRRRRALAAAEAAVATAAGAAVAVAVLGPAARAPQPTGWSVRVTADHEVAVNIKNPSALDSLQGTLQAAGAPVYVAMNPGTTCSTGIQMDPGILTTFGGDSFRDGQPKPELIFTIDASRIPAGQAVEVLIYTNVPTPSPAPTYAPGYQPPAWMAGVSSGAILVQANGKCLPQ